MCLGVAVISKKGNFYCETVQELADALGVECSEVSSDPPENCLCNFNGKKLGARQATDDEGYPFPEMIIERP